MELRFEAKGWMGDLSGSRHKLAGGPNLCSNVGKSFFFFFRVDALKRFLPQAVLLSLTVRTHALLAGFVGTFQNVS